MATLHPYLHYNGTCRQAFEHYRTVFGGDYMGGMAEYGDAPPKPGAPALAEDQKRLIMNVSLPIGPTTYLNGSDWPPNMPGFQVGTNVAIYLAVDSRAEADRILTALSSGGTVTMPMEDTFWGAYFGMLTDAWGIQWMISHYVQPSA